MKDQQLKLKIVSVGYCETLYSHPCHVQFFPYLSVFSRLSFFISVLCTDQVFPLLSLTLNEI